MNSSKSMFTKKRTAIAAAVFIIIVLALSAYTIIYSRNNPCDSLFEQAAIRVHAKIKTVKKEEAILSDPDKIRTLSEQSQKAAVHLKTCCNLFHEEAISFDEFVRCQENFKNFETAIDRVAVLVVETKKAKQEGKVDLADYKLERLNKTIGILGKSAASLQEQINLYSQRSPLNRAQQGELTSSSVIIETEPNDDYSQGTDIQIGVVNGKLSEGDRVDFFKTEVLAGNILKLDFTPGEEGQSMRISLQNIERNEIWNSDPVTPGVTKSHRMMTNSISGGTYYLVVAGGIGAYRLALAPLSQNDADSGTDAADQIAQALGITPGHVYSGELGGFDKEDWYKIEIPSGHVINLAFTPDPESGAMNFSLRNQERAEIWYSNKVAPGVTQSKRIILSAISGGTYYLSAYNGSGSYKFELSTQSQNDANSGTDAGDTISKALAIEANRSYAGELGGLDEEDWFRFDVPGGHILNLALIPDADGKPMRFSLFSFKREQVLESIDALPGVSLSEKVLIGSTSGGTYYLKVFSGDGAYRLEMYTRSQNDAGSGADAGDLITKALKIESGHSFLGELGGLDEEDWYTFSTGKGENIHFICDKESEPMRLSFHTLGQMDVGYAAEVFPGVTKTFGIPDNVNPPYFVRVFEGRGAYTIEIK